MTEQAPATAIEPLAPRTTVIVTQRERFGMTAESLDSLFENTSGFRLVYVDANSPARWGDYLKREADRRSFTYIRTDEFLMPNQSRNIGIEHADTEYVVFCDNDVLFTPGWLDALVARADAEGADIVAPLTCQGMPAHSQIHHAGGDYAADGDTDAFFVHDNTAGRPYVEIMHGHREPVSEWQDRLEARETGMCEFHCVLARRSVFDTIGPLDENMLSTKEHIDFSMSVKQAGGSVWFEPKSVITYVFPCRQRPMSAEDWPFFSLRWSNDYGRRSLEHFIRKWNLDTPADYVESKKMIYILRRWQGILIPFMRALPLVGRSDAFAKKAARWAMFPERLINQFLVARHDRKVSSRTENRARSKGWSQGSH